ncbi:hypothetical protein O181_024121 [Austropuccinia psidii MF-1]|uniref:Uncharacterized protein n=1 Tax=Austropuccinia psidii MF-1 TaxID=1389203 RepID=A0A9Q3GYB2_9BASI|nr:hypothetical protein [Austropuccinia psidii MF-1]
MVRLTTAGFASRDPNTRCISIEPNPFPFSDWMTGLPGWGGDLKCSQTGFIINLGDTPILWGSKRKTVVALSTCGAVRLDSTPGTGDESASSIILQAHAIPGPRFLCCCHLLEARNQSHVHEDKGHASRHIDQKTFWASTPYPNMLVEEYLPCIYIPTLHAYNVLQLSSCNLKAACQHNQKSFPHLLLFGGGKNGTDGQSSFATLSPISLGNAYSHLLLFGGDRTGTDQQLSFATLGPISLNGI